jgi:hypothetical protein
LVPTLLVGLGGSGVEVLLGVRRLLQERGGAGADLGRPLVAYLALDTDPAALAGVGGEPVAGWLGDVLRLRTAGPDPEALDCSLRPQELLEYFLGGGGRFPHIFRWLQPELSRHGEAAVVAGAGQNRLFGRLAFFHHFRRIRAVLSRKLQGVAEATGRLRPAAGGAGVPPTLEVIVVHSLGGGTGSGMFLDVGMLLRRLLGELAVPAAHVRLVALLPEAFVAPAGPRLPGEVLDRMRANAFAALRELEYFALGQPREDAGLSFPPPPDTARARAAAAPTGYAVQWERDAPAHQAERAPWNTCYLIGGSNDALAPASLAPHEVCRMVAERLALGVLGGAFGAEARAEPDGRLADPVRDGEGRELYRREHSRAFRSFGLACITPDRSQARRRAGCRLAQLLIRNWWLLDDRLSPAARSERAADDLLGAPLVDRHWVTATHLPGDVHVAFGADSVCRLVGATPADDPAPQTWWDQVEQQADDLVRRLEDGGFHPLGPEPLAAWSREQAALLAPRDGDGAGGLAVRSMAAAHRRGERLIDSRLRCLFLYRLQELGIPDCLRLLREYAALLRAARAEALQACATDLPEPNEWRLRFEEARRLPLFARRAARWELLRGAFGLRDYWARRFQAAAARAACELLEWAQRRVTGAARDGSYAAALETFEALLAGGPGVLALLEARTAETRNRAAHGRRQVALPAPDDEEALDAAISRFLGGGAPPANTPAWGEIEAQVLHQVREHVGRRRPWGKAHGLGELVLGLVGGVEHPRPPGQDDLAAFADALAEACAALLHGLGTDRSLPAEIEGLEPAERRRLLDHLRVYSVPYLVRRAEPIPGERPERQTVSLLGVPDSPWTVAERFRSALEDQSRGAANPLHALRLAELRDDTVVLYQEEAGIALCAYAGLDDLARAYDACPRRPELHLDYPTLGKYLPEIGVVDQAAALARVRAAELTLLGLMTGVLRWREDSFEIAVGTTWGKGLPLSLGRTLADVAASVGSDPLRAGLEAQLTERLDAAARQGGEGLAILWGATQNLADELRARAAPEAGARAEVLRAAVEKRLVPGLRRRLEGAAGGARWLASPLNRQDVDVAAPGWEQRREVKRWQRRLRRCYTLLSEEVPVPVVCPDAHLAEDEPTAPPAPPGPAAQTAAAPPRTPPEPALAAEAESPRLRHALENLFPAPVARAFYQLRGIGHWLAEVPQLANVLGVTLQHLTFLALAEYLAGSARDADLSRAVAEAFRKPVSHGTYAGLLRQLLTFLRNQGTALFAPELLDAYFRPDGIGPRADALVELRNDLLKRSTEGLPAPPQHRQFKGRLLEFLQAAGFLKEYPLVSCRSTTVQDGIRTHACALHVGFHDRPEDAPVQCDLDLEVNCVALLHPRAAEVLSLYPLYLYQACPEAECGHEHLFRLDRAEKNRLEYVAGNRHRLRDARAAADLHALLQGPGAVPSRRGARYLFLGAAGPQDRLPPGHRLKGKYEIVELLRSGGMAQVYRVRCLDTGAAAALKLLPYQFLSDRSLVQRFRDEVKLLRGLDHPNIARVLDADEDLADHFLVLELADGWQTAAGRALDAGELPRPLPVAEAVAIVRQACEALGYIHGRHLIHRDVKPGNLLLFDGGLVKLTDFGVARTREALSLTLTGLAVGTPEYMAPEQAEGTRDLTPAADLYALGVVLYELLTGVSPFRRKTPLASAHAHLYDRPAPPRQLNEAIPDALQAVVLRCLEKAPERRLRSARELYDALRLW